MFGFIRNLAGAYRNHNYNEVEVGLYNNEDTVVVPALPVVREFNDNYQFLNKELNQTFTFREMKAWAGEFFINALPFGHGAPFLRAIEEYADMYQQTQDEYVLGLLNAHLTVWDRAIA